MIIKNSSNSEVSFHLNIDDKFPVTQENIVINVKRISDSLNLIIPEAAWLYVCNISQHAEPITLQNWIHNPIVFLNSIGQGYCDDHAALLAILWKWLGYNSRIWNLTGHVVPEVYYDSAWHMMDPDYEVYYLEKNHQIASVHTLERESQLITEPIEISESVLSLNRKLRQGSQENLVKFSSYLAEIYQSSTDNELSPWSIEYSEEDMDLFFLIPPKSKITFPTYADLTKKKANYHYIKVTTYQTLEEQNIKIPLIFIEAKTDGEIITDEKTSTKNEQKMNLDQDLFNKEISIVMTTDSSELYYALNPNLFSKNTDFNKIHVNSPNLNALKIER